MRTLLLALLCLALPLSVVSADDPAPTPEAKPEAKPDEAPVAQRPAAKVREPFPKEIYFGSLKQLTFTGENAEAYWSCDEKKLIFQSTRDGRSVDQIYTMNRDGSDLQLVSTGGGRTTCAYYLPGDQRIVYATTHLESMEPPTPPVYDRSLGYVWPIFNSYAIVSAKADGTDIKVLAQTEKYDAEATVSPKGDRIVFTSTRDGDLDLYSMNIDGSDVKRLTSATGYDGGAFFNWDGTKIVWRAPNREDVNEKESKELLARQLVRPSKLEIWIMNADGSGKKMITRNGAANFAPFWHPDGKRIIFASNMHDPRGGNFELYLVNIETLDTERVTWFERKRPGARRSDDFDGFPMFTRDGKTLVFCSNRHNEKPNETNVFVAEWKDK